MPERLRRVDLEAGLTAAGFGDVEVCDRPGWRPVSGHMGDQARSRWYHQRTRLTRELALVS